MPKKLRLENYLAKPAEVFVNVGKTLKLVWETDKKLTPLTFLLELVSHLLPVIRTWLIKLVIDQLTAVAMGDLDPDQAFREVIGLVGLMLVVTATRAVLDNIADITLQVLTEKLLNTVNYRLLETVNRLQMSSLEDPKFFDKYDKVRRQSAHRPIRVLTAIIRLFGQGVTGLSFFVALISFEPLLLIPLLLATIPLLIFDSFFAKKVYFVTDSRTPQSRLVNYLSYQMFSERSATELRIFGLHGYFYKLYKKLTEGFFRENTGLQKEQGIKRTLLGMFSEISYYAAYLYVAVDAVRGLISVGDFNFYVSALSRISSALERIFRHISGLYENSLYLNDLFEFLNLEPSRFEQGGEEIVTGKEIEIVIEDLSFKYLGSDQLVLRGIDMTIKPGESVALVGKNGAGKTTLVKLLCGLYQPTGGRILVNGISLENLDLEEYRKLISVIFQDFSFYHFTAAENIGFGNPKRVKDLPAIRQAAKKAGAHEFIEQYPKKYKQMMGKQFEGGIMPSIGQLQKLALARAFMKDVPIMIMDEPTASSDPEAELALFKQIKKFSEDKSLILISHRFSTVKIAKKIYVIEDGRITESGSHQELLDQGGTYARLYTIQAEGYKD